MVMILVEVNKNCYHCLLRLQCSMLLHRKAYGCALVYYSIMLMAVHWCTTDSIMLIAVLWFNTYSIMLSHMTPYLQSVWVRMGYCSALISVGFNVMLIKIWCSTQSGLKPTMCPDCFRILSDRPVYVCDHIMCVSVIVF